MPNRFPAALVVNGAHPPTFPLPRSNPLPSPPQRFGAPSRRRLAFTQMSAAAVDPASRSFVDLESPLTAYEVLKCILLAPLGLVRLVTALPILILLYLTSELSMLGHDMSKPMKGFRKLWYGTGMAIVKRGLPCVGAAHL